MKNKSKFSMEVISDSLKRKDECSINEVRCFKDGKYTHSVKIFVFPDSIIDEIMEINGRKSIS